MPSEFELIARHFQRATPQADLGVGDDAALLSPGAGQQLAVSTDMLVAGTHFFPDTDPHDLGWKALAVNVSDLAAMGAQPRWVTLALALPAPDEAWVAAFASGFFDCAASFGVDLVGGDTTRGPLNLCPTVFGEVPRGRAITRSGARPGDELWISGQPGRAALGLWQLQGRCTLDAAHAGACLAALQRPQPRLALGLALRGLATAMLDVSDGLLGDLGHILECSRVGAQLLEQALPLDALLAACADPRLAREALLRGGDDYELLFTAPAAAHAQLQTLATRLELPLQRIGRITRQAGQIDLLHADGTSQPLAARGYDHFAAPDTRTK